MRLRRQQIVIIGGLTVAVVGGSVIAARRKKEPEPQTAVVERRNLVQSVSMTGHVQARKIVQLALVHSGKISRLAVGVGDSVQTSTLLAAADPATPSLEVERAEATRAAALARAELDRQGADAALRDTRKKNAATLEKRRQAVRDAKRELDQQETVRQREIVESGDESVKARSALLNVRKAETTYHAAQQVLREDLAATALAEEEAVAALDRARAALAEIQQTALGVSGPSVLETDIALQKRRQVDLEIRAPFAGTVTSVDAEVGEVVPSGTPVVTIVTFPPYEVVADVPEVDAVKLVIGQRATVTLDAHGSDVPFEADVKRIDPAATLVEGVPTFKTSFAFTTSDDRIRPGMTASIEVRIAERAHALSVPSRALAQRDDRTFVRVVRPEKTMEERTIRAGLRASDGFVEILEGLSEGENIVTFLPK